MHYVFDLDGCISDCSHRLLLIQGKHKNWDEFFQQAANDKPIRPNIDLAKTLDAFNVVIFITGRSESIKEITLDWLNQQGFYWVSNNSLYMRKLKDYREDSIIKPELLLEAQKDWGLRTENAVIFEDRKQVVDAYRALGWTCYQVCEGNF